MHHAGGLASAAGLAEERHIAGVAAEFCDVVLHPLQRGDQIDGAGVARLRVLRAIGREIERADDIEAVVDADDYDVAELAEILAVIGVGFHRRAVGESAAVHPDHDRLFGGG